VKEKDVFIHLFDNQTFMVKFSTICKLISDSKKLADLSADGA